MIKKNIEDIKRHKEIIESILHGYQPYKICEHFNITHNELLAIIEYYHIPYDRDILPVSLLREDKALFIADTHLSSEKDNLEYLHAAYDYAEEHEIRHVVHLGDVLQAGDIPVRQELQDPDNQMAYFDENYPRRRRVKSHLLFGNHDLKILDKDYNYMKVIQSRPDMDVLGFKIAYLQWGRHVISLFHKTKHYHLDIPNTRTDLHLEGHKHAYSSKGKIITVPALSDDIKQYSDAICEPGFLVGEQSKNRIKFDFMSFEGDKLHNRGKVYERRFNK